MAELTLTTFLTLDGVMQAPGGPTEDPSGGFPYGGWLVPLADDDMGATISEIFNNAGAFLLGRTTYDIFADYWPKVSDPHDPVAKALNSLPKFVASRTRTQFDWKGSTHIPNVIQDVGDLKQRVQGELQVHGSCGLAQTLIANDLIDEYRLFIFPVLLGTGKRLFGGGAPPASLHLVSTKTTSKGMIVSIYRRGAKFSTGSF